jgi:hypothetical protein
VSLTSSNPAPAISSALPVRRSSGLATKPTLLRPAAFFLRPLFLLLVAIPNLLSVSYYAFIASPVYVSTASLAVSNPSQNARVWPRGTRTSLLIAKMT